MPPEQRSTGQDPALSGDYEYDLAHDFASSDVPGPAAGGTEHAPVYVVTETSDVDEDLSYDLAHDVPSPGGHQHGH